MKWQYMADREAAHSILCGRFLTFLHPYSRQAEVTSVHAFIAFLSIHLHINIGKREVHSCVDNAREYTLLFTITHGYISSVYKACIYIYIYIDSNELQK